MELATVDCLTDITGVSFEESDEKEEESQLELFVGDEGIEGEEGQGLFVSLL